MKLSAAAVDSNSQKVKAEIPSDFPLLSFWSKEYENTNSNR